MHKGCRRTFKEWTKGILLSICASGLFGGLFAACSRSSGAQPAVHTLANGMRVVVVHFPKSTNVSIFTFSPMSLCSDGPGQAQWSHLVEHLVIRSTFPNELQRANAETLPDHLRLDFYGNTADWKEGLSHHGRWLEGVPFREDILAAEKPKVISECDFTSRNFATHKFALAAWSHASRHSNSHVAIKGDVLRAGLGEVQRYRNERLFVPQKTTICAVGGVDAPTFIAEAEKQLGKLTSPSQPAPRAIPRTGTLDVTWDLDARHLVLAWPVPDFSDDDYAPLMSAAQWLSIQYFSDAQLKAQTGQVLAGTELATPEGNFFYVSASIRPGAAFADVEKNLRVHLDRLSGNQIEAVQIGMLGKQLASSLAEVPNLQIQAPPGMKASMVEANVGLFWGMNVHRYGSQREALARKLRNVSAASVRSAALKYLVPEKGSVCTISPVKR
jgi:predicted Zn-dependent peptidase